MSAHNSLVATYADHALAQMEIARLAQAGFDMSKLRLVAQDNHPVSVYGVPVVESLGALAPDICECIPEGDLVDYESELRSGRWILVAHATPAEIDQVRDLAETAHPTSWDGVADSTVYYGCID